MGFISLLATLVLFWTLTIVIRPEREEVLNIGNPVIVVMKALAQPMDFWTVVGQGMEEASREFGVPILLTGPNREKEIDLQLRIFDSVLNQDPPLIILVASDYFRLEEPVGLANQKGIPIITMDSDVNSDVPLTFVGTDNVEAGKRGGYHMAELLAARGNPHGRVGIVSHNQETATGIDRETGVRTALAEEGVEIAGTWFAEVDQERAYQITLDLLADPSITGIIALNEVTTLGIAQAIREQNAQDRISAVGFDNAPQILTYLEQEILQATVVQQPYNMGYLAVRAAYYHLRGKEIPNQINTGSILITRENMFEREYQELLFPFAEMDE